MKGHAPRGWKDNPFMFIRINTSKVSYPNIPTEITREHLDRWVINETTFERLKAEENLEYYYIHNHEEGIVQAFDKFFKHLDSEEDEEEDEEDKEKTTT